MNRGDVLEISTRSGDWLQIVNDGGKATDSWIMWRTDILVLLVEIPGQISKSCKGAFVSEEESVVIGNLAEESAMVDVTQETVDESVMDEDMEDTEADSCQPHMPQEMALNGDVKTRNVTDSNPAEDSTNQFGQSMDVDMTLSVDKDVEDTAHMNGEALSDSTEDAGDDHTGSASDLDEENLIVQDRELAETSWDERPIGSTKQAAFDWDEQPIGTSKKSTVDWDQLPVGASKISTFNWDEQPVGSSKAAPSTWDERPLDVKTHSNEWEESEQEPTEQDCFDSSDVPEAEHIPVDDTGDSKMISEMRSNISVVEVSEHANEHSTLQPQEFGTINSEDTFQSLEPDTDTTSRRDEGELTLATISFAWDERPIRPQNQPDLSEFDESEALAEETSFEVPNENASSEERQCMDDEKAFAAEAIETLSFIEKTVDVENDSEPNDEHMEIDNEATFDEKETVRNADASIASNILDAQDEEIENAVDKLSDDDIQDQYAGLSVQQYSDVIAVTIRAPSPSSWDDRPIRPPRMPAEQEEQLHNEANLGSDSSWSHRPIRPAMISNDAVSQDGETLHYENENEDNLESLTSQNRDSVLSDNSEVAILQDEGIMDSGDEDMPVQFVQHSFTERRMQEPTFPTKHARYEYFEDVSKSKQQAREEEQVQIPKMDGISFIIRFGIAAYCAHRHSTTVMDDPFAQLLTDAVMLGRNPDAILQALVADEPPWDDWVMYTTPRIVLEATREDAHGIVDVLYARDSDTGPVQLQSYSPTTDRRNANMERSFKRMSIENTMPRNFNLIMHSTDADADAILEAEFGADEVSFDLVYPYKYPVLSGARTPKRSMSVYASGSISTEAHQPIRRISRGIEKQPPAPAQATLPAAAPVGYQVPILVESPVAAQKEAPAPTQTPLPAAIQVESQPAVPDTSFTSPAPKSNPLKRAAAAIAKTPPVIPPKPVEATSAGSATKTLKRSTSMVPPTTRGVGVKPPMASSSLSTKSASSTPSGQRSSSMSLRPPTSIGGGLKTPSRVEAPIPSRRLTMAGGSLPNRSSLPSPTPTAKTTESLLQRKSFLQAPSPSKLPTPGSSTSLPSTPSTTARSMSVSGGSRLPEPQSRRLTFGFGARPASAIPPPRK